MTQAPTSAARPANRPGEFDLQGRPAWATNFFFRKWRDMPIHTPSIIEEITRLRAGYAHNIESHVAVGAKSDHGLVESPLDLFETTTHPGLHALASWIEESVRTLVSMVNGNQIPPERLETRFTDSWFHVTNDHGFHDAHVHGNCSWCGIYYIKAGESGPRPDAQRGAAGNGINRFYSPINTGGMVNDYGNTYLETSRIDITPTDGLLFLFPSYILHSALAYRGKEDRIVIAFNTTTHVRA